MGFFLFYFKNSQIHLWIILGMDEIIDIFSQEKACTPLACSGTRGREIAGFPAVLSVKH